MKDIPLFTTQNGAAGLTLREIPYRQKAYITIHETKNLPQLLDECTDFCKAVGAEEVYACNHAELTQYPVSTRILEMVCPLCDVPQVNARLQPAEDVTRFAEIYNRKMANIPGAKYLDCQETEKRITAGNAYFVYRDDLLIGFGIVEGDELCALGALQRGAGREVVCALCAALAGDTVHLEVASENHKAIRLYEALGFQQTGIKNTWYKII